jgi:hypothetical protein
MQLSSVLTATDRGHPTGTRKEGSNGFPTETRRYQAAISGEADGVVEARPAALACAHAERRQGSAASPWVRTQNSPPSRPARNVQNTRTPLTPGPKFTPITGGQGAKSLDDTHCRIECGSWLARCQCEFHRRPSAPVPT